MSQFVDAFKPDNGDLLYGKARTRKAYLDKWNIDWERLDVVTMIDNLNNAFHLDRVTSYGDLHGLNMALAQPLDTSKDKVRSQAPHYKAALEASRFAPQAVFKQDADRVLHSATELVRGKVQGELVARSPDDEMKANLSRLAIKRSCKFGIAYVASCDEMLTTNALIHYAIDDLDFQVIVDKQALTRVTDIDEIKQNTKTVVKVPVKKTTAVPITTSEMRYIFRHWAALRTKVVWYLNYARLDCAPWEGAMRQITDNKGTSISLGEAMWQPYREHVQAKGLRKTTLSV